MVADSSRWYQGFTPESHRHPEDLNWSLIILRANIESTLADRIERKMIAEYHDASHGGPLLLMILLADLKGSSHSTMDALKQLHKKFDIKKIPGEDVSKAAEQLVDLCETLNHLCFNSLPDETVKHNIAAYQTTSVPEFNKAFEDLETRRLQAQCGTNSLLLQTAPIVDNNLNTVHNLSLHASKLCRDKQQNGTWDEIIKANPKTSTFVTTGTGTGTGTGTTTKADRVPSIGANQKCFNFGSGCDGNHHLSECPKP